MTDCIIKKIAFKDPGFVEKHIAIIKGKVAVRRPAQYKNIETGQLYSHIIGAVAWPNSMPGFVLIVGVESDSNRILCLEEFENKHINELLQACITLREKYGYWVCSMLFRPFLGDFEAFLPVIDDFNSKLYQKYSQAEDPGFYPAMPPVEKEVYRVTRYINRTLPLLDIRNPQLIYGPCNNLRESFKRSGLARKIKQNPGDNSIDWNIKEFPPPLMALGHIIYALQDEKPWLIPIEDEITPPDPPDWELYDHGPWQEENVPDYYETII